MRSFFKKNFAFFFSAFVIFSLFPLSFVAAQGIAQLQISIVSLCGNGILDGGEECEGVDLQNQSCHTLGYTGGTLGCTASCLYNVSSCTDGSSSENGGGGGGGGGGSSSPRTSASVQLNGRAFPLSTVVILKDGQRAVTTIADPDARFSVTVSDLSSGTYSFSLYSQDDDGQRSSSFTFSVSVTQGTMTTVGGIFLSPTISLDASELTQGDTLTIFGKTAPESVVTISVHSVEEIVEQTAADDDGVYTLMLDTAPLEVGSHIAKSKASLSGKVTDYSTEASFTLQGVLGDSEDIQEDDGDALDEHSFATRSDVDGNFSVNLVDFSIVAYWYLRPAPPDSVDINNDGVVNLVDFSIMAFYWTG